MFLIRAIPIEKTLLNRTILQTYRAITNPKCNGSKFCVNHKIKNSIKSNKNLNSGNLFNDRKFKILQHSNPNDSTTSNNNNNNNDKTFSAVSMGLIQFDENNERFLIIPIDVNQKTNEINYLQEFPKSLLINLQKINKELVNLNNNNYVPIRHNDGKDVNKTLKEDKIKLSNNIETKLKTKTTTTTTTPSTNNKEKFIQKKSNKNILSENIEDVNIYDNVSDIFGLNLMNNAEKQKDLKQKSFSRVTLKFDMDMAESKNFINKIKSKNSNNLTLPFNAIIDGFIDLKRDNTNNLNILNNLKNELSISAYICKIPVKKDKCAKPPKCKFGGMAGKLQSCEAYKKSIERANYLREKDDGIAVRRFKIILGRQKIIKQKPCKPSRHNS